MLKQKIIATFYLAVLGVVFSGCKPVVDTPYDQTGCVEEGSANQTISALFVGNSLTTGVPSKVTELLKCGGYATDIAAVNPGGYKLYQHMVYQPTLDQISKSYDQVILQEQSGGIYDWHSSPWDKLAEFKGIIESAGSEMVFYQTWGYTHAPPDYQIRGYEEVGVYFNVKVVAVGRAWELFYETYPVNPPFSLFSDDRHASTYGQHLISYVFYSYLTGESPVGLSNLTLNETDAAILQDIAWQVFSLYP